MHRAVIVLVLIAGLAGGRAPAQEVYEVPVELELRDAPLVIDLDVASLEIVFDPDATPTLRALRTPNAAATALAVSSDGGTVVLRRAPADAEAPADGPGGTPTPIPRLRLELVLDPARRLDVFGSDLDVAVAGQRAELGAGEADDDEDRAEDDGDEDEEDEDDEEGEEGGAVEAVPIAPADPHRLFFDVAVSSVDLIGVESTRVRAVESYLHASGTRGQLTLDLEGGTAEVSGHQGVLDLTSRDSEVALGDSAGRTTPVVTGGSLIVSNGSGPFNGRFVDGLLRVEGWRGGPFVVAGSGATVEVGGLVGVRLELRGEGLNVALEDLQGYLLAELIGGSFTASQIAGKSDVRARAGTELSIDGVQGQPTLILENSSARLVDVNGVLKTDVKRGRLEVDGAQRLELVAVDADVVAGRIEYLTKVEVTDSRLDLDLWELMSSPSLSLLGATEARVRLRMPCSVKLGESTLLGGGVDVTGCELHSQRVRRTRYERRGVDGNRRMTLTATLGEDSTLEVEGAP